jgi:iron complex outermembrane receptor protein
MSIKKVKYIFVPSLVALAISSAFAAEQSEQANVEPKVSRQALEVITVTAQKRGESIQEVPITVSALSGEDLKERGTDDIQSYSNFVPGMVFSGTAFVGERSGPDITIRGVANSRLADFETSIATATTGFIYGEMPAYSFDPRLMDIKRVEVLKGPQGTLYGAASMGGTVKVIPNSPNASEFEGKILTGLGYTHDGGVNTEFGAMANIPLIEDVLAVRVSGFNFVDSGFIDVKLVTGHPNEQRGGNTDLTAIDAQNFDIFNIDETDRRVIENSNEVETFGGQFALKYTPNDVFEADFSLFYQSKDQKNAANFEPSLSSSINERTTELYILQPSSTEYTLGQLHLQYDFGFAAIHSVTGSLNRRFTNATDFSAIVYGALGGDGTQPVPGTAPVNFIVDTDVFSQEFRLQGDTDIGFGTGLNWIVGVFYQTEDRYSTGSVSVNNTWMVNGTESGILPTSGTDLLWGGEYQSDYESTSFFVDLTFGVTEKLDISIGARTAKQELDSSRIDFGNVFAGAACATCTILDERSIDEDVTTPRFAIAYAATKEINLYATASEGFRIGGGNAVGNLDTAGCQTALGILGISDPGSFDSDSVWNYEAGVKTSLLNNTVNLNMSAFNVQWDDLQVSTALSAYDDTCGASVVANVGAAELNGIELELKALVTDNFEVGMTAEFNDAELTEGDPGVPGAKAGDPLKNVPDFAMTLSAQYYFEPINNMEVFARIDYIYTDERSFSDVAAGPSDAMNLPSYDLLNLRLTASSENWNFTAFVDNLLDETPELGVQQLPGGPGDYVSGSSTQRFVSTGRPLTVGIQVGYVF